MTFKNSFIYFICVLLCWVFTDAWTFLQFLRVRGCTLVAMHRLLSEVSSLASEHGLQGTWGSVVAAPELQSIGSVVVHGLSCSAACGIFPDQRSNLCLGHGQMDSLPLSYQGSPDTINDNVLNKNLVEKLVISYSIFLNMLTPTYLQWNYST